MTKRAYIHGGSWFSLRGDARCADRGGYGNDPGFRGDGRGFRVVLRDEKPTLRGGSWSFYRGLMCCASRFDDRYGVPSLRGDWGFRVAVNDD